ncbi:hypothetical protein LP43_1404 [Methylophaga thiooxydans]|uniref:Uncharacterized protein n=1 Tax=Methylophaga thiooxydans TaxID=392484 RepID=A0A0A0BIG3_9GAMM|nr:hypothetical protein LP43_1404 [Methylophaga thiooxydans]
MITIAPSLNKQTDIIDKNRPKMAIFFSLSNAYLIPTLS